MTKTTSNPQSLSRDKLHELLSTTPPDNEHRTNGYALINVLDREAFESEHIPGSINIPLSELDEVAERFDPAKEIVVYCASPQCDASPSAANRLAERGFRKVYDYEGGISQWRAAGYRIDQAA